MIYEAIAADLPGAVLEDMSGHLLLCCTPWVRYGWTWSILSQGSVLWSLMDCILRTDRRLLYNVFYQDPRHNADSYMIL